MPFLCILKGLSNKQKLVFVSSISVFKSDKDTAKLQFAANFLQKKIMNPGIILQMNRSTTNVFEAVRKARSMCVYHV